MSSVRKMVGVAMVNSLQTPCEGSIEILSIDRQHKKAYVSWGFSDTNGQFLGSKSRNYFLNKEEFTETDIVEAVLENIMNYRIGRSHVFTEVKIT